MNIESNELHGINIRDIANKLKPLIVKKNTRHCFAILMEIQIVCMIYKLFHGSNLLTCSEQFAIGKSNVGLVV
jgi:hypothetical protein